VRFVEFRAQDCTLDLAAFRDAIGPRTRLVAVGAASNAVGTVNDVRAVAELAHAAGALCFVDAVQHAPHLPVDVRAMGCDLLACSAYKFFGPHVGVLWGRLELLERLPFYKVRPAPDRPPEKLETGTQNHEGIAGVLGAIEYLEELGRSLGAAGPRRAALAAAMEAIASHERALCARLLDGLAGVRGLHVYGITDPARLARRVPTVSFTLQGWRPRALAERLAREEIYVWDGHYYALELVERLGLREAGGMLRVGLAHYNTAAEVDRLVAVLKAL
jgi:cysteine desulfurase family protein (TIGR01976 family)